MEIEMQRLPNRFPRYPRIRKFKIDSLQQKAFEALPRDEQLKYISLVRQGIAPKVKMIPFMTEKEYHTNRLQYERDKHPEIYKDVPRVGYGMRKIRGKDLYKVFNTETREVKSHGSTKQDAKAQLRLLRSLEKKGGALQADQLQKVIQNSYKDTTEAPEGYAIDPELSDDRVKVYKDLNSNQVIVAHRGSKGFRDWLDNAFYATGSSIRDSSTYKMAKDRQQKAIDKYGSQNIISVGHSRAGKYVEELNKETPVKEVITYNKAVAPQDILQTNPENQTDVRTSTDVISALSPLQFSKNKVVVLPSTYDLLKAHSSSALGSLGNRLIGKGRTRFGSEDPNDEPESEESYEDEDEDEDEDEEVELTPEEVEIIRVHRLMTGDRPRPRQDRPQPIHREIREYRPTQPRQPVVYQLSPEQLAEQIAARIENDKRYRKALNPRTGGKRRKK